MAKDLVKMWRMAQASVLRHVEKAKDLLHKRNVAGVRPDPDYAQIQALERLIRDEETAMAQAALRCKELEAEIRMVSISELAVEAERVRKAQERDVEQAVEDSAEASSNTSEASPGVVEYAPPAVEPVAAPAAKEPAT